MQQQNERHGHWTKEMNERERQEIRFARIYLNRFGHGTGGHMAYMLLARFSVMNDLACGLLPEDVDREQGI